MFAALPPLTLYIHFPWCVQKCPYCDFNSHAVRGDMPESDYIDQLIADFKCDLGWIQGRTIDAIFCGGGTPSLFLPTNLDRLLTFIRAHSVLAPDCEITLEANPGTVDQNHFSGYVDIGINRLSLGVQSFDDRQLKNLGRIHNKTQSHEAITILKTAGFRNFNVDIMYGLPNQTQQQALHDLQCAIDTGATHISWYHLTLEPNTLFYRHPPKNLPETDDVFDLEQAGYELLSQHGLDRYEVSAFSTPQNQCQHNLNYWQFGDYIGIGAGAHGKITDLKNQSVIRLLKHKHPKKYLVATDNFCQTKSVVANNELAFEFMLNALRLMQPIKFKLFESRTQLSVDTISNWLSRLSEDELAIVEKHRFTLTELGRQFLNDVIRMLL